VNGGLIWNKKKMNGNIMSDKEMFLAYCNDQIELFKLDLYQQSAEDFRKRVEIWKQIKKLQQELLQLMENDEMHDNSFGLIVIADQIKECDLHIIANQSDADRDEKLAKLYNMKNILDITH